jgi:hypothetical protein
MLLLDKKEKYILPKDKTISPTISSSSFPILRILIVDS